MTKRKDQPNPSLLLESVFASVARITLIAAMSAFLIFTASKSVYYEIGILAVAALSAVTTVLLFWNTPLTFYKNGLVALLLFACLTSGLWAVGVGRYQSRVQAALAKNVILKTAGILNDMRSQGQALPEGPWWKIHKQLGQEQGVESIALLDKTGKTVGSVKGLPRKDGWGCMYDYWNLGESGFLLRSSGPDLRFGTRDDLLYLSGASYPETAPLAPEKPGFGSAVLTGLRTFTGL